MTKRKNEIIQYIRYQRGIIPGIESKIVKLIHGWRGGQVPHDYWMSERERRIKNLPKVKKLLLKNIWPESRLKKHGIAVKDGKWTSL